MVVAFDVSRYNVVPTYDPQAYQAYQKAQTEVARQNEIAKSGLSEPEFSYLESKGVSPQEYSTMKSAGYSKQAIFYLAEKGIDNPNFSRSSVAILNRIISGGSVSFTPSYYDENYNARDYSNAKELYELAPVLGINKYIGKGEIDFAGGQLSVKSGVSPIFVSDTADQMKSKVEVKPGQFITAYEYSKMEGQKNVEELLSGKSAQYPTARYSAYSPEFIKEIQSLKEKGQYTVEMKNGEYIFTETPASVKARQDAAIASVRADVGKEPVALLGSGKEVPYSQLSPEQQSVVQSSYGALEQQANQVASNYYGVSGRYYSFQGGTLTDTGLGTNIQAQPQKYGLAPTTVFTEQGGMTLTPKAYLELKYPSMKAVVETALAPKERPLAPGESRFGAGQALTKEGVAEVYATQTGETGILRDLAKTEGAEFASASQAAQEGNLVAQFLYTGAGFTLGAVRTAGGIRPLIQKAISSPEPVYIMGKEYQPVQDAQNREVLIETTKLAALTFVAGGYGLAASGASGEVVIGAQAGAVPTQIIAVPLFAGLPSYEKGKVDVETIAAGAINVGILPLFEKGSVPVGKVDIEVGSAPIKAPLADIGGVMRGSGEAVIGGERVFTRTEVPASFDFLVEKPGTPTRYVGLESRLWPFEGDIAGIILEGGKAKVSIGRPQFVETTPTVYAFEGAGRLNLADEFSKGETRVREAAMMDYFARAGREDLATRYALTKEATMFAYGKELPFEKGLEIIKEGEIFKSLPKAAQENLIEFLRYSQPQVRTTFYGSSMQSARGALERPYGDIDVFTEASAVAQAQGAAEAVMKGGGNAKVVEKTLNIEVGGKWEKAIDFHDLQSEIPGDTAVLGTARENVGFGLRKKADVRIPGEPRNIFAEASGTQAARLGSSISFLRMAGEDIARGLDEKTVAPHAIEAEELFLAPGKDKIKRSLDFINIVEKTGEVFGNKRFANFEKEFAQHLNKYEAEYIKELRGKQATTLTFGGSKGASEKVGSAKVAIEPSEKPSFKESPSIASPSRSPSISSKVSVSPASPSKSPSIQSPSVSKSLASPSPSKSPSVSASASISPKPSISPKVSISPSISISPRVSPSVSVRKSPSPSISPPSKPPSSPPSKGEPPSRPPQLPPSKFPDFLHKKGKVSKFKEIKLADKKGYVSLLVGLANVARSQARYGTATHPLTKTASKEWGGAVGGEKQVKTVEQSRKQTFKSFGFKGKKRLI